MSAQTLESLLIACTTVITVCTILIAVVAFYTVRNYYVLRELQRARAERKRPRTRAGLKTERYETPPRASGPPLPPPARPQPSGSTRRVVPVAQPAHVGADLGNGEWTGPVEPYTPADRRPINDR